MHLELKIKRVDKKALMPVRAYPNDVGMDVTAIRYEQTGRNVFLLDTGLAVEPPDGYYIELHSRSGIHKTEFIMANQVGIIDPGYRGRLSMPFRYVGQGDPEVAAKQLIGKRIGQIVLRKLERFTVAESTLLSDSTRSGKGFGSSGE